MNKTIIDAVNELKGDLDNSWLYSHVSNKDDRKYIAFRVTGCDYRCYPFNHSSKQFQYICTIEEFNDLVSQMETNFGECSDVAISHWKKCTKVLLDKELDKELEVMDKVSCYVCHVGAYPMQQYCGSCGHELLSELIPKQPKPVFTQEMCDNGDLPSVGMECLIKMHHKDDSYFQKGYINGYSQDKKWIIFTDYLGNIESHNISNGTYEFKPLTPPIELIDGKAYQFDIREQYGKAKGLHGIYSEKLRVFQSSGNGFHAETVDNIQPLTVKE